MAGRRAGGIIVYPISDIAYTDWLSHPANKYSFVGSHIQTTKVVILC